MCDIFISVSQGEFPEDILNLEKKLQLTNPIANHFLYHDYGVSFVVKIFIEGDCFWNVSK